MTNRDKAPKHNLETQSGSMLSAMPSLAEQLSVIALRLADLEDFGSVCGMLARRVSQLGVGAALLLPRPLTDATVAPLYVIYHLCDPGLPAEDSAQDPSEPFFPTDQPAVAVLLHRVHGHAALRQDFDSLAKPALAPHAQVRAGDQGLLLPLMPHEPGQGLLLIWGDTLHQSDTVPLSAFASMLGLALKVVAGTTRQNYRHQTEQETLLDISRILLQGSDLRAMLGEVAEIIMQTIGGDLATIYLYNQDAQEFEPFGAAGWDGGPVVSVAASEKTGEQYSSGLAYVYHKRLPIIIDDEWTETRFGVPTFVKKAQVRSVLITPIAVSRDDIIGAVACSSIQENFFREQSMRLLVLFANSTAQAIERLRLHQDTQRRVDELSILYQIAQLTSDASDEDLLLQQVTDIIHTTLYPNDFGFLLLNYHKDGLVPHASYRAQVDTDHTGLLPLDNTSVSGQVFISGMSQRFPDISRHPAYREVTPGMRSELCVPLMAHNEILGVINAESREPNYFSAQDEMLLMTISGQVAAAIQRIRHYVQEHQQGKQIENLRQATSTLASSLDLEEVLTNILNQLESLIAYDSVCIFLKEERGLLAVAAKGFSNMDEIVGQIFTADQDLYRAIEQTGRPLVLTDTREDKRFHGWAKTAHIRSWMGVPMHVRGRVIGYITIDNFQPGLFTDIDAELAQPFANQAATVIENARLFESERRQLAVAQAQQEVGRLLTSQLALSEVLEAILEILNRVVPADSASIMLMDESGEVSLSASRNIWPCPELIDFTQSGIGNTLSKFSVDDVTLIGDTMTDPRWVQVESSPIRSWVGALLTIQDKAIGMLNIDGYKPYAFDQSILPIVRSFANQAAVAIHNARMFDLTQQSLNFTEILYTTARTLIETQDLNSVARIVVSQARNALGADQVTVHLMDLEAGQVLKSVSMAAADTRAEFTRLPEDQGNFDALWTGPEGDSLRRRTPRLLSAQSDTDNTHRLIVPLVYQETSLGVIVARNGPDMPEFTQRQLDLLMAIGNQAATAIKGMQLFDALDREKNQLEERVKERTQDLALANEQLKELDRLKSEFIANVSHELRTPLTNIKLYINLLSRTSTKDQNFHISVIEEQTDQLQKLIETVLNLSRLDASRESETDKLMPVELGRLIISLVEEIRPIAQAKGVGLEILALSNRAYVQGDRTQLIQLFKNLLTNAISYTEAGGAINLQVRREGRQVNVVVEDTGMGIDPEEQPRIFDRFARGQQAVDANIPGTGLGLSIVKEIIDRHAGQIEVVSQLKQGSKFIVRLPTIPETL